MKKYSMPKKILEVGSIVLTISMLACRVLGAGIFTSISSQQLILRVRDDVVNNHTGRFNLEAIGKGALLFNVKSAPWSSFTTVKVDGIDYIYGDRFVGIINQMPQGSGQHINMEWKVSDITIEQKLKLVGNPTGGGSGLDMLEIEYDIKNKGNTSHTVGLRILLDVKAGYRDMNPVSVNNGVSVLQQEMLFNGGSVPSGYIVYDSYPNYTFAGQGILSGYSATKPDILIVGNMDSIEALYGMINSIWGYTSTTMPLLNGGIALYWNPVSLAPSQKIKYKTYYGILSLTPSSQQGVY